MNKVTSTAPKKIYLQISDDASDYGETFPYPVNDNITWCQDSVMECEVAYVRADLIAKESNK